MQWNLLSSLLAAQSCCRQTWRRACKREKGGSRSKLEACLPRAPCVVLAAVAAGATSPLPLVRGQNLALAADAAVLVEPKGLLSWLF